MQNSYRLNLLYFYIIRTGDMPVLFYSIKQEAKIWIKEKYLNIN